MLIRPYASTDLADVKGLWDAQGGFYQFFDPEQTQFLVRAVLENGTGHAEMALFLRKTAEAYLLFDPRNSRRETVGRILAMTKECQATAKRAGLTDIHAWIPPQVETKKFRGFLEHMGWIRESWASYVKAVSL